MTPEQAEKRKRIPKALQGLDWQYGTIEDFTNGDELLVAVGICIDKFGRHTTLKKSDDWRYEFSIVTIEADEDYYRITLDGDSWGWERDDVEWYIRIR